MKGKLPTQTYHKIAKNQIDYDVLRNRLKLKHLEEISTLYNKHPHVKKYFDYKKLDLKNIREHSAKIIGAGAVFGALLLAPPDNSKALPTPYALIEKLDNSRESGLDKFLIDTFKDILPDKVRPLTQGEEKLLEQIFYNSVGIKVNANLEGEHLNTTYGLIGAEQHLVRYPGDKLQNHGTGPELASGMAPGRGAWGYFATNAAQLSDDLVEKEKWYAVVQTLYLPDWNTRQPYIKNWYKYRKVMIVNTNNAKAVIATVADSGPAAWTGKHFGGSPEVMNYLGGLKYKKGPVLVFFVDDPENKIPLGPVEYNKTNEYLTKLN